MSTPNNIPDDFDFMPDDAFAAFEADYRDEAPALEPAMGTASGRTKAKPATVKASTPSTAASTSTPAAAFTRQPVPAFNMYGEVPDLTRIPQAATQRLTDMGLAVRYKIHYEGLVGFTPGNRGGSWYSWTGTHWEEDDKDNSATGNRMRTVIASITNHEAKFAASTDPDVVEAQKAVDSWKAMGAPATTQAKAQQDLDIKTAIASRARLEFGEKLENGLQHIAAAIKGAQSHMTIPAHQWNTNPYLLNFRNGTLDIRTLVLTPHDPAQYITKVTAVDWVPGAKHPDVDRVLATLAKSDEGLPKFLQRYLGAACTDLNSAKAFFYLKGPADAGKTTLFEGFAHSMGDLNGAGYARIVNPSLFALSSEDSSAPNPKLHDVRDVRFIFADEAEGGFMNRVTMNRLSAGGLMDTRPLYGSNVSWKAKCKILLAGNDWMPMPDNDPGLRRRLIAMELTHRLSGDEVDVNLQDRIRTDAALEAILAWAVQGAHEWILEGADLAALHRTPAMIAKAEDYLSSADPLEAWWDAYVIEVDEDNLEAPVDEDSTGLDYVPLKTVQWHEKFVQFSRAHGVKNVMDFKHFANRLTARGFESAATSAVFKHEGVQLNKGKFRRGIRHRGATVHVLQDQSAF